MSQIQSLASTLSNHAAAEFVNDLNYTQLRLLAKEALVPEIFGKLSKMHTALEMEEYLEGMWTRLKFVRNNN